MATYRHQLGTNPDSVNVIEKSLLEKPNKTLSDPGIEPRTPCSAVALATTRPARQSTLSKELNPGYLPCLLFVLRFQYFGTVASAMITDELVRTVRTVLSSNDSVSEHVSLKTYDVKTD